MKWIFNYNKITSSGYCEFRRGLSQGGNPVENAFLYSPLIEFPGTFDLSLDEHGHHTRSCNINTEIKITIYDSYHTNTSLGSVTYTSTSGLHFALATSNEHDQYPSTNTSYPDATGSYYLQIQGSQLIADLIQAGVDISSELGNLHCYPVHFELACTVEGCKYTPHVMTLIADPTTATYNAGYYYIPFQRPVHDIAYASVWARAAVRPDCPYSIMEMVRYDEPIYCTQSTDQMATEISMINAIFEIPTNQTCYIKLSYNTIQDMLTTLDTRTVKVRENGWVIQVQLFWYKTRDAHEFIGTRGAHQHYRVHSSDHEFKHDISIYHGATPVHKKHNPDLDAFVRNNSILQVDWNPDELIEAFPFIADADVSLGLAICSSAEYNRVLKVLDITNPKERRARGRIRPKETIFWIGTADLSSGTQKVYNLANNLRGFAPKKIQYFINNMDDPYVYVRPVLGYWRSDCDYGNGGYHWLCASDKYFLIHL